MTLNASAMQTRFFTRAGIRLDMTMQPAMKIKVSTTVRLIPSVTVKLGCT
jgi:hypothetical protein